MVQILAVMEQTPTNQFCWACLYSSLSPVLVISGRTKVLLKTNTHTKPPESSTVWLSTIFFPSILVLRVFWWWWFFLPMEGVIVPSACGFISFCHSHSECSGEWMGNVWQIIMSHPPASKYILVTNIKIPAIKKKKSLQYKLKNFFRFIYLFLNFFSLKNIFLMFIYF